jgi:hypothetical protein
MFKALSHFKSIQQISRNEKTNSQREQVPTTKQTLHFYDHTLSESTRMSPRGGGGWIGDLKLLRVAWQMRNKTNV